MEDAAQRAKQLHPDSALVQRHAVRIPEIPPRAIWVWLAQRCFCFWFQYVLTQKKTALLILLIFVHFILIWLLNVLNGRFSLHIWVLPVLPVLPVLRRWRLQFQAEDELIAFLLRP